MASLAPRIPLAIMILLLSATPVLSEGFYGGVNVGYSGGPAVQATGTFHDFTRDLPLSARLTLGYNGADAGDPYAARRIFINDNTNGDPEKSASTWQFRFDLMFPVFDIGPQQIQFFVGARHARYTAHYNFVGGNEVFDISSNPWGVGLGLETWFVMGERTDFVMQLGFDYYGEATIEGHDTAYLPSGDHVNPRNNYTWDDADAAIGQPRYEILGMIGIKSRL